MKKQGEAPAMVAVDESGKPIDIAVLEQAGVAFDPTQMHLDLTKDEKRRTTSLLLAIQAYEKLIIKDAEMLEAVSREHERHNGPRIAPATIEAMVQAAIQFDLFISGQLVAVPKQNPEPESAGRTEERSQKMVGEGQSG